MKKDIKKGDKVQIQKKWLRENVDETHYNSFSEYHLFEVQSKRYNNLVVIYLYEDSIHRLFVQTQFVICERNKNVKLLNKINEV